MNEGNVTIGGIRAECPKGHSVMAVFSLAEIRDGADRCGLRFYCVHCDEAFLPTEQAQQHVLGHAERVALDAWLNRDTFAAGQHSFRVHCSSLQCTPAGFDVELVAFSSAPAGQPKRISLPAESLRDRGAMEALILAWLTGLTRA
jgi:hypothetical protein